MKLFTSLEVIDGQDAEITKTFSEFFIFKSSRISMAESQVEILSPAALVDLL